MGKTIREKTSLLPRSCVITGHLAVLGVSLLTCGSPATGKGSVSELEKALQESTFTPNYVSPFRRPFYRQFGEEPPV